MDRNEFAHDKAKVRRELERRAKAQRTITYGELSTLILRTPGRLTRLLNAIRAEDDLDHKPDIRCLVVKDRTGLPGFTAKGDEARADALATREMVFGAWRKRSSREPSP